MSASHPSDAEGRTPSDCGHPWFGCFTGDCPHETQAGCDAAIRDEFAKLEHLVDCASRSSAPSDVRCSTCGFGKNPGPNYCSNPFHLEGEWRNGVQVQPPALPVPAQEAEIDAEILRAFVRKVAPGGCKVVSLGAACPCPLCAVDRLAARLRSPSETPCPKCAQREARMFPIMDGPDVPWSLLEPHEKHAMKNHGQTLERLAERGGLAAVEALQILDAKPFGSVKLTVDYANRILAARVRSLRSSDSSRSDTDNG